METYNIYCDESCHLENDNSDVMVLGAIMCKKQAVRKVSEDIRRIKEKHGLSRSFEIKWTKVSSGKLNFYRDVIDYFINNDSLSFRTIIARGKKQLSNEYFNQTYDEWYYKMYYLLLVKMLDPIKEYNIYIDIKDTNGGSKVRKLKEILNSMLYEFRNSCVRNLQIIRSDESELLQLSDLLIGAVSYKNRYLSLDKIGELNNFSEAKRNLCGNLMSKSETTLEHTTKLSETKFNIFVWEPREIHE